MLFNPTRSESSLRRGILHNAAERPDGTWSWRYDRFVPDGGTEIPDFGGLWDAVDVATMPLLLVRGADSPVVDDDDVAELRRRAPHAAVEVVPGAGHSVQGDQPLTLGAPAGRLRRRVTAAPDSEARATAVAASGWTRSPIPSRPELPSPRDVHADVVVVGAGFTGLWTAYELLRREPSLRVVLVEAEIAGFGASGRNGGWCSALFAGSREATARRYGRDAAVAMQRAMFATIDEVGGVCAAEGIDAHFVKGGTLEVATKVPHVARLRQHVEDEREWGFGPEDVRWLDAVESGCPGPRRRRARGGVHAALCAHPPGRVWSVGSPERSRPGARCCASGAAWSRSAPGGW